MPTINFDGEIEEGWIRDDLERKVDVPEVKGDPFEEIDGKKPRYPPYSLELPEEDKPNVVTDRMKRIYLACPYSHESKAVRMQRVIAVDEKAAELMEQRNLVFSPLSHSHPISMHTSVEPCDHEFWLHQDLWILRMCDELHILCLEGWNESRGVDIETEEARKLELPIFYHYYIKGRRV